MSESSPLVAKHRRTGATETPTAHRAVVKFDDITLSNEDKVRARVQRLNELSRASVWVFLLEAAVFGMVHAFFAPIHISIVTGWSPVLDQDNSDPGFLQSVLLPLPVGYFAWIGPLVASLQRLLEGYAWSTTSRTFYALQGMNPMRFISQSITLSLYTATAAALCNIIEARLLALIAATTVMMCVAAFLFEEASYRVHSLEVDDIVKFLGYTGMLISFLAVWSVIIFNQNVVFVATKLHSGVSQGPDWLWAFVGLFLLGEFTHFWIILSCCGRNYCLCSGSVTDPDTKRIINGPGSSYVVELSAALFESVAFLVYGTCVFAAPGPPRPVNFT